MSVIGVGSTRVKTLLAAAIALAFVVYRFFDLHHLVDGYDAHVYWRGAQDFLHHRDAYRQVFFVTPPSGLIPLAPFGALPFTAAYWFWQGIGLAAAAYGFWTCFELAGWKHPVTVPASVALCGLLAPAFMTIALGNLNAVIFMLFAVGLRRSARGDEVGLGLCLGLGLALKPVIWPITLLVLLQRRWRAIGYAIGVPAALSVIGLVLMDGRDDFFKHTLPNIAKGAGFFIRSSNFSIHGVLQSTGLGSGTANALRALAVVLAVFGAAAAWRQVRPSETLDLATMRVLAAGTVLIAGLFLSASLAWTYYTIFLVPGVILLLSWEGWVSRWLMAGGLVAMWMPDNLSAHDAIFGNYQQSVRILLGCCTIVTAFTVAAVERSRSFARQSIDLTEAVETGSAIPRPRARLRQHAR